MPDIPNAFSIVSTVLILTGFCHLLLGVSTFKADPHSLARRYYFFTCLFLCLWSVSFGLMTVAVSETAIKYFWMAGFISFYLFPPSWFSFLLALAGYTSPKVKTAVVLLYTGFIVLIALCISSNSVVFVSTPYGNQFSYQHALIFQIILYYLIAVILTGPLLFINFWGKSRLRRLQKQAATFMLVTLIIAPPGLWFDFIVPTFFDFTVPPISSFLVFFVALYLYFTLRTNNSLNITVQNVSEYLFRSVTMPVLILDHKNRVVLSNTSAIEFLGPGASAMTGKSIREIINLPESITEAALEDNIPNLEVTVPAKGDDRACDMLLTVVRDTYHDILSKIVVLKDVTEMRNTLSELRLSKELAEQASLAKSEFLSRMSHELRTPLNAILGMVNIGRNGESMDKATYCFRRIDEASKHLLGLINDVLDMSKIEANKFELSEEPFNLEELLKSICNIMVFAAEDKKLNLLVDIDPAVPLELLGDELRLSQVITNLLSNAIKFSTKENSSIQLNIKSLGAPQGGESLIRVEVIDQGIGMNEAQQAKIFLSFEQAEGSIVRRFGGTGLGLSISKRIIELMGGEIGVESHPGEGSRFFFTFRAKPNEEAKREERIDKNIYENLRVLVVDESRDMLEYFMRTFFGRASAVHLADNAEAALQLASDAGRAGEPYRLIFVNYLVNNAGGLALARELKRESSEDALLVVISPPDRGILEADAAKAGVACIIQRPLFRSTIFNTANELLSDAKERKKAQRESRAAEKKNPTFENCRLLLVEDIEINREIAIALLEKTKIAVDCAEDGEEALHMFRAEPNKYDIIFMDLHMPIMDGLEATRQIRALSVPQAARVPIIALTANAFKEDVDACKAAGMNDHISKPINVEEVLGKVAKYLRGKED